MNRTIVYPGSIPLDSDLLSINRNAMLAIGALAQATLGTNVVADGLVCTPTSPASFSVLVGPGSITSYGPVDVTAYGSLPADTSELVVKMGVNLDSTTFTLTLPSGTGTAINYLIEADFGESDTTPVVLPYYDAADPSQPYTGPNNAGTAQNTLRAQQVQLRLVAGTPAPTNFQVTPNPDAGWVGLYVITVYSSMTSIGGGTIFTYPTAPFLPFKLPQLTPGQSSIVVLPSTQSWNPPFGVTLVKLRMVGGGGGGGAGGGGAGGGGAGAGSVEGYYPVVSGTAVLCTIGAGGVSGGAGGSSSFGTAAVAAGGGAGGAGSAGSGGTGSTSAGTGSGTGLLLNGGRGQNGFADSSLLISGAGGGSSLGCGAANSTFNSATNQAGTTAIFPGSGGAGGVGTGAGGLGAAAVIVLEW
jgi:hypothetical protein